MILFTRLFNKLPFAGTILVPLLFFACKTHPPAPTVDEVMPAAYQKLTNPFIQDAAAIAAGEKIFMANCVSCHGIHADGNGPAAMALPVKPANFLDQSVLPKHTNAYLFWRISEGKPGTAMPKWKGAMDEKERWQVVSYLRKLESDHQNHK